MTSAPLRPLGLGEILDHGFGLYRTLFVPLVVIAAVCRLVPVAMNSWLSGTGGFLVHPWLALLIVLLSSLSSAVAVAATTLLVSRHYLGEEVTAGDALRGAGALVWKVIVVGLCTSLVVGAGILLLVIPGLILLAGLTLSTPALILEQPMTATGAMARSWELTRGARGKVLVTVFVATALIFVPVIAVSMAAAILSFGRHPAPGLISAITGALAILVFPYFYTVVTILYYDLRVRKEGLDIELLTAAAETA